MNIVTKPAVLFYTRKYPLASNSLLAWYKAFSAATYSNFNELKAVYANASVLANNRVIFNVKGNSFRLIVGVDFKRQAAYIIWFGTHKEYDKVDAATVAYIEV